LQARVFVTAGHDLFSIDAKTGKVDERFGVSGKVDLRDAFDAKDREVSLTVTSPGTIYKDLLILGSSVSERLPATYGDIRAYDVHSGKLRWTFHTIPRPGEFGYQTWSPNAWKTTGAANNWTGMALDEQRGLVYVPTGSAAFDFYGADRIGDDSSMPGCRNGKTEVALPGDPPRRLGPGFSVPSHTGQRATCRSHG
jgi:quinoprotein glucose dehydrogenase